MGTITLKANKGEIFSKVAETTAYTGAKMGGEDLAETFKRISTVDEDESELERFWEESRADICQELIGLVQSEGMQGADYRLTLNISSMFDSSLTASMETNLRSYFVYSMAAKWYVYTNKGEAKEYADKSRTLLEDIHRKAVYKKKPKRPTY